VSRQDKNTKIYICSQGLHSWIKQVCSIPT